MSYPFLPVNSCCTDIVLNNPCGCSSTMTNVGCGQNPCETSIVLSSNVLYDGPNLSCIIIEPCDTLNVILQKIDQIICNLLNQINTLNIQIHNITTQIINIEGDLININNQLAQCCNATTTTTTTTKKLCEQFSLNNTGGTAVAITITDCVTGIPSAIVLLPGATNICVVTDSPLIIPGTVIATPNGPCSPPTTSTTSTSSTSTSSSTTTTTTTAIPCECLTFYNRDSVSRTITYKNCSGATVAPQTITVGQTIKVCGSQGSSNSALVTISIGANCISGVCPADPTTSTTSTTLTTTSTSSSTTTTSTTCNPSATHPYSAGSIYGTSTDAYFINDLTGACNAKTCLVAISCYEATTNVTYFNNAVPQIGDTCYGTSTGCVLTNIVDGYYVLHIGPFLGGTYTVIEVVNSKIVAFPVCP